MQISAFIVEDEPDVRAILVEAMEEITPMRFVGHAETERDARQWLCEHGDDWDLVIVDLSLSEGSGLGVLVNCGNRKPNQKVVVLTSFSLSNIANRCLQLGADQVFDKGEDVEKFVLYCREHARRLSGLEPLH
ncbi:MAG: response regulator [Pseudomonadota bacterium]